MKPRLLPLLLALLMLLGCAPRLHTLDTSDQESAVPLKDGPNVEFSAPTPLYDTPTPVEITEGEAIAIALTHAQYTHDQVRYIDTAYEIDDGVPQYEVEFRIGRTDFEYEIHAETGEVLSFEVHR